MKKSKCYPLERLEEFDNYQIEFSKHYENISKWKFDKIVLEEETETIRKIEVYNYISRDDVYSLINFLSRKEFKYFTDTKMYPPIFNILLAKHQKYTSGQGLLLNKYDLPQYYYYNDFVRVLNHRGRAFLLRIYWNKCKNKKFAKFEITYHRFAKKRSPIFLDWLYALKSMNEIIKKLEKNFNFIGYGEDYSKKISFNSFIKQVIGNRQRNDKVCDDKVREILLS